VSTGSGARSGAKSGGGRFVFEEPFGEPATGPGGEPGADVEGPALGKASPPIANRSTCSACHEVV
jgi:hypothetical protein